MTGLKLAARFLGWGLEYDKNEEYPRYLGTRRNKLVWWIVKHILCYDPKHVISAAMDAAGDPISMEEIDWVCERITG